MWGRVWSGLKPVKCRPSPFKRHFRLEGRNLFPKEIPKLELRKEAVNLRLPERVKLFEVGASEVWVKQRPLSVGVLLVSIRS